MENLSTQSGAQHDDIVGGVPAKPIRRRFDDATIKKLEALRWWDWDCEKIKRSIPAIQSADLAALEEAE